MTQESPIAPSPAPQQPRGRGMRVLLILTIVLLSGLSGAVAARAFGNGFGPGFWHHGWHRGGMMRPLDPVEVEERADRIIRHVAIEIDATADQQDKLRAVAKAAVKDLIPVHQRAQAARLRARELLTQTDINRADIEKFRTEQVALFDSASKRLTQALTDAAEILTPEQRRQISERLPPFAGRHGWRRD